MEESNVDDLLSDVRDKRRMNLEIHKLTLNEQSYHEDQFSFYFYVEGEKWKFITGSFAYVYGFYMALQETLELIDKELLGSLFYLTTDNGDELTLLKSVTIPASKSWSIGHGQVGHKANVTLTDLSFLDSNIGYPDLQVLS